MDEDKVNLEAHVLVLQYFVVHLQSQMYKIFKIPADAVFASHDEMIETIRRQTFPGLDPVSSDLVSDEIQVAAQSLATSIEEMAGMVRRPKG